MYIQVVNYHSSFERNIQQVLNRFSISPMLLCSTDKWHVVVSDRNQTNTKWHEFEFASSDDNIYPDSEFEKLGPDGTLVLTYDEVGFESAMSRANPTLENHIVTIELLVYETDGSENVALRNSLYRAFAAQYFQALELFKERFICGKAYVGDEAILF